MYPLLIVLHLIICLALIGVVLVQSGKGGGLAGGAFGGSAQTVFGGRGATDFFTKATMVLGAAFFITSMALALMSSGNVAGTRSLIQTEARQHAATAPGQAPGGANPSRSQAPATASPAPATGAPAAAPSPAPAGPAARPAGKR